MDLVEQSLRDMAAQRNALEGTVEIGRAHLAWLLDAAHAALESAEADRKEVGEDVFVAWPAESMPLVIPTMAAVNAAHLALGEEACLVDAHAALVANYG